MCKWVAILFIIFITACSKSHYAESSYSYHAYPRGANFSEILSGLDVQCANGSSCPEQVGEVIGLLDAGDLRMGAEQCTGFLVSYDIVATNSHCIPDELKTRWGDCTNSLAIKFPATGGYDVEVHKCVQVLGYSKIQYANPLATFDWAFFRIGGDTSRSSFRMTRTGLPDNMPLTIYAIDPLGRDGAGRLKVKHCETKQGSYLLSDYNYDFNDLGYMTGEDCKVIQGNSGSPVLNEKGEVPAILFAMADPKSIEKLARKNGVELSSMRKTAAFVTNYACLDLPSAVPAGSPSPFCDSNRREKLSQRGKSRFETIESTNSDLQDAAQRLAAESRTPALLRFTGRMTKDDISSQQTGVISAEIVCLLPQDRWPENSYVLNGSMLSLEYSLPSFRYKLVLDDDFRVLPKRMSESKNTIHFSIDLQKMKNADSNVGEKLVYSDYSTIHPIVTHWCTEAEMNTPAPINASR